LRGEILAAASKMFADRGYEAVTLREIAKEIGYTHAVIYQHFPDKWHILVELSSETIGLMVQDFDAIAAKHLSPKERLFATSRGLIQFCIALHSSSVTSSSGRRTATASALENTSTTSVRRCSDVSCNSFSMLPRMKDCQIGMT
jgi:AcrR family transcriptional regulator